MGFRLIQLIIVTFSASLASAAGLSSAAPTAVAVSSTPINIPTGFENFAGWDHNPACGDMSKYDSEISVNPTGYYTPTMIEDKVDCSQEARNSQADVDKFLKVKQKNQAVLTVHEENRGANGKVIMEQVRGRNGRMTSRPQQNKSGLVNIIVRNDGTKIYDCTQIKKILDMQGAGTVLNADNKPAAVYQYRSKGQYKKVPPTQCPAGYGTNNTCLNPFRTVAAHLGSSYRTGDVIFVAKTKGMKYPEYPGQPQKEWATHDGHWVVGDSGGAIKDRKNKDGTVSVGRLDFFSGLSDWHTNENPLKKLGLGNINSTIPVCKLNQRGAQAIKDQIGYPGLAMDIRDRILTRSSGNRQAAVAPYEAAQ